MAKMNKAEELTYELAAGLLRALRELGRDDCLLDDGSKAGTKLTGYGLTAKQARKLEGYGCVKVTGRQKIGLGHRLEVKLTALGRRVAEEE